MESHKTKRVRDLREKIVCLLLSNQNHKPSCQCVKSGTGSTMYSRPLDESTIGLANNLIQFIETAKDESNDFEAFI